ncbi:hypothetical protein [Phyllobacterium ifriqiyense]|uniref:hypothetical protein n=1 Tax=Phyllobacterium ifriqiyense TaxID=314238 RepID=UPI003394DBA2
MVYRRPSEAQYFIPVFSSDLRQRQPWTDRHQPKMGTQGAAFIFGAEETSLAEDRNDSSGKQLKLFLTIGGVTLKPSAAPALNQSSIVSATCFGKSGGGEMSPCTRELLEQLAHRQAFLQRKINITGGAAASAIRAAST